MIPYTHAVSVGRFCRLKGPSPRRFAPAGRTNPLTRHTLVDGAQKKTPPKRGLMSHKSGLLIYFAAGSVPPVFAHVLRDVLSVGWVPGCVTGRKVVQASSGDHLARLHVALRGLSVKPFGNRCGGTARDSA